MSCAVLEAVENRVSVHDGEVVAAAMMASHDRVERVHDASVVGGDALAGAVVAHVHDEAADHEGDVVVALVLEALDSRVVLALDQVHDRGVVLDEAHGLALVDPVDGHRVPSRATYHLLDALPHPLGDHYLHQVVGRVSAVQRSTHAQARKQAIPYPRWVLF